MLKNYIKIAWRNLYKNKTATGINLVGLITGMTCCLLMVLYLQHELSYDKFQANANRIVRVIMEYSIGDTQPQKGNFTSTKVLPAFRQNFPEVENGVRMTSSNALVKLDEEIFMDQKFLFADSTFFHVFPSFRLLSGSENDVLDAPKQVVVSASTAKKYFGNDDPVGRILQIGANQTDYIVTGVVEDSPSNSQIKFDFLASFSSLGPAQESTYWNANYTTYLLLNDENSIASLQQKIGPFMEKEMADYPGVYLNYELEPYLKVHLYSPHNGFEPNGNITYLYITGGIALLILLIACFTYINLGTARTLERAKEVGIRKATGAGSGHVFWQFIGESAFLTTLALLISICMVWLLLPSFNDLVNRELPFASLFQPTIVLSMLVLMLCISLLAGSYPALVLSKFNPVKVLKGNFRGSHSGVWLKKSLFVFQFVVSVFLIIATFIMQGQMNFIQSKNLGYDREHSILLGVDQKINEKKDLVKTVLKQHSDIRAVSFAYETPVNINGGYSMYSNNMTPDQSLSVTANPIDEEYIQACGLELVAGQDLSIQDILDVSHEDYTKNHFKFIINESAAKVLGWTAEEAIGKKLFLDQTRPGEVKGVVKDFHFASLHNPISPLVLFPEGWSNVAIIKTSGHNLPATLSFLEDKWKEIAPYRPFSYQFMDETYASLYSSELRINKILRIFSVITILLACLGLFGLASYTAEQRTKEIGIRKVLGASVTSVVSLLSRDFIKLVLIAIALATPLSWYAMNRWLQDFAYRIEVEWWLLVAAGFVAVVIALLTVGSQALRSAVANPVRNLRSE
ncbi:ABC transporter permease [Belliella marina]|uniref:ABC transporter permease n=1 Tax=Belliella marina TaxID=1644146 RepID=A0ABW4VTN9_9BACT